MDYDPINAAIEILRAAGFTVTRLEESEWLTPGEVAGQLGLTPRQIVHRLTLTGCPEYRSQRGASGRLIRLRLHPALRAWLLNQSPTQPNHL